MTQEVRPDTPSYCEAEDLCQTCDLHTRIQNLEASEYDNDNRIEYLENQLANVEELIKDLKLIILGTDVAGNEH
jgi:hypothetical protein